MNYRLVTNNDHPYLECLPDGALVQSERDALDLVAACGENRTDLLLLHAASLPEDFYHLSTGLAGRILLKFSNYHIRCALILSPSLVNRGRFQDMVIETNRGNEFRVFYERQPAEQWLASLD